MGCFEVILADHLEGSETFALHFSLKRFVRMSNWYSSMLWTSDCGIFINHFHCQYFGLGLLSFFLTFHYWSLRRNTSEKHGDQLSSPTFINVTTTCLRKPTPSPTIMPKEPPDQNKRHSSIHPQDEENASTSSATKEKSSTAITNEKSPHLDLPPWRAITLVLILASTAFINVRPLTLTNDSSNTNLFFLPP